MIIHYIITHQIYLFILWKYYNDAFHYPLVTFQMNPTVQIVRALLPIGGDLSGTNTYTQYTPLMEATQAGEKNKIFENKIK